MIAPVVSSVRSPPDPESHAAFIHGRFSELIMIRTEEVSITTQARAKTTARGYGSKHQQLRVKLLPTAYGKPCPRCGRLMLPGQALDLDHTDSRSGYLGFSHSSCNRRAGQRKGARLRRKTRTVVASTTGLDTSRRW